MTTKLCNKCNKELPLTGEYFQTDKGRYSNPCKECRRELRREWRKNNPEKVKALKKRYYEKNRDKIIARNAEYVKKNPGVRKAWAEKNRWRFEEYSKRYKEYQRQWRQANKEHIRLKAARRRLLNGHPYDKKIDISDLLEDMGCGICKMRIDGPYHIDHIMPLKHGGSHTRENLQLAHPMCNLRKGAKILT